jgi:hypothetical protein
MYLIDDFLKEGKDKKIAIKQLQALLVFLGDSIVIDGDFGVITTKAVKRFQKKNNLNEDGKIGEKSWMKLYSLAKDYADNLSSTDESMEDKSTNLKIWLNSIVYLLNEKISLEYIDNEILDEIFEKLRVEIDSVYSLLLTDEYIDQKSEENGLSPAVVKAVIKVESSGRGFDRDKRPNILFEGHKFWSELKSKGFNPEELVEGNENILYRYWTKKYYSRNSQKEYSRLYRAMAIDENSALKSASWGMFQIMGFNHKLAGFKTVHKFIEYMKVNEKNQLEAFFTFLKKSGCFKHLQSRNWAKFARCYNGSGFKKNGYDSKLEKAYFQSKDIIGEKTIIDEIEGLYARELEDAFLSYSKQ